MKKILLLLLLASYVSINGCICCKQWLSYQGKKPADPSAKWMWSKNCRPAPMPLPPKCGMACNPPHVVVPPPPPPPVFPNCATKTYPCGSCGTVELQKCMPNQVQTNADFEYTIKVTNLSDATITDVVVTDMLGENLQYKSSTPPANIEGSKLTWIYASLGPKEYQLIKVVGVATASGIVKNCADVTYKTPVCAQTLSVQPVIVITKTAPAEVSICDTINVEYKIQNTGTGPANNVRITDTLPAGLVTAQGSSRIEIPVGTLPAGAARMATVTLKAQNPGTFTGKAVATADGNINIESLTVTTAVRKPVLAISTTGPQTSYIDREVTYDIAVTNNGDWPVFNTMIENPVPAGLKFVRASQDGALINNKVMWQVAKLNPGAVAKASVTFMTDGLSSVVDTANTSGNCCDSATSSIKTEIVGVPAVLLETIDLVDPVKIGQETTYKIVVTNQGSAIATNVAVKAILEPQMEYVSNAGATQGTFADGTITFAPLSKLDPKTRAIWEVTVRAKAVGDVRFKAVMRTDQLTRDVEHTESTNFYHE